ncbi:uncharacterized protein LOC129227697 isoform X2 [Uloborus diversus]|nr:uncharacterized protein LOC129227697 isoform X2 [Uloborus diversus]XP_054718270.1 uncharacterized protein LOC129227697 isoform X2 [Uloborus diversus]XP_054718271.1 uncharacterized protein LOC129227697 isoform X2 [Uloborus diversus]XP_054718272.1 uncharacterized protein LOC129227697 isoform X2 [Uloborus diversus]XP_054718273.1 uncharacterized protein LOC129227697 isoform X2 [Uloborus diversus]
MNFSQVLQLHIAVAFLWFHQSRAYSYNEILKLNASCSPKDTCALPRDLDNSADHNCDCSSLCVLYDTCCIDSHVLNISSKYDRPATCRYLGQSQEAIFMIEDCSSSYAGAMAIRRRCEQTSKNWSDPFNNIPVTNPYSQKTYKSLFCALCNSENVTDLTMWQVMMDCSSLNDYMQMCTENRDFVLNNMVYISEKGLWGLWSWDSKSDWKFRYLPIHFHVPPGLKDVVKHCRPNLISDCPTSWQDSRTRKLCKSYMGAIYINEEAYRNVHCAICNGVEDLSNLSCHDSINATRLFKSPTMSFGLLLDIDLRHGDAVGNVDKTCGEEEVYDPFSKKCRTIECPIPGFTLKNRKCVPS